MENFVTEDKYCSIFILYLKINNVRDIRSNIRVGLLLLDILREENLLMKHKFVIASHAIKAWQVEGPCNHEDRNFLLGIAHVRMTALRMMLSKKQFKNGT